MRYDFDYNVQRDFGAYVDNYVWHDESVFVPDEIVEMIYRKVR